MNSCDASSFRTVTRLSVAFFTASAALSLVIHVAAFVTVGTRPPRYLISPSLFLEAILFGLVAVPLAVSVAWCRLSRRQSIDRRFVRRVATTTLGLFTAIGVLACRWSMTRAQCGRVSGSMDGLAAALLFPGMFLGLPFVWMGAYVVGGFIAAIRWPEDPDAQPRCPNCDYILHETAAVCSECGRPVTAEPDVSKGPQGDSTRHRASASTEAGPG